MNTKPCDQCGEYKQLTHRIRSDIMNLAVCYSCGVNAELLQSPNPGIGNLTITLFERPKIVPMFFECSLCHGKFIGEQGYANHWHEEHC